MRTDERDSFRALAGDAAREEFIIAFWAARDPTPSTRENEFRSEHLRRLRQAERRFGRASPTPGFQTERGRTWILLGPPRARHFVPPTPSAYPMELWLYAGSRALDLPAVFRLLFVQKHGVGEYQLYDPSMDGPESLVGYFGPSTGTGFGHPSESAGRRRALRILARGDPEVAAAALSLFPTDPTASSIRSSRLIGRIHDLPARLPVDRTYLARFRDDVAVESSFPDLDVAATLSVADGLSCRRVELVVTLPPEAITLERRGDRLTGAVVFTGRVERALDGVVLAEIEQRVELALSVAELAQRRERPLRIEQWLSLAPGAGRLRLLVRDVVSDRYGVVDAPIAGSAPSAGAVTDPSAWVERIEHDPAFEPVACAESHLLAGDEEAALCALAATDGVASGRLRARLHLDRGEAEMALASLFGVRAAAADDARWLQLAARALTTVGDEHGAEQALQAALDAPVATAAALNALAHVFRMRRDRDRATIALDRSLELDPIQPAIRELRDRLGD